MTLGGWFRDYVYIPLGGNRVSKGRWVFNIFVVWMLTGFWHGAAWNFVIWGLMFAVLLLLEKWLPLNRLPDILRHGYVILIVMISFVIFNAESMAQAWQDISGMFGGQNVPLATTESVYYLKSYALLFLAGILGATPLVRNCAGRLGQMPRVSAILRLVAATALLLICTAYLVDGSFNPFLYFRF
jgi:alginate O-acetyltransferase complex protein AlgI